ncbi:hypothetical protein LCGC14_2027210, partial [marine sediment metagenome]
ADALALTGEMALSNPVASHEARHT